MAIEQEIQQPKFKTEHQRALVNLLFTYGWSIERIKQLVTCEGITHQQYNILRILRGSLPTPLSTLQIRERMLDKMSDTSRIVDRLVVKGLARKTLCKKDRRLVDVTITEKGKKLLEKLDGRQPEMDNIFGNLSVNEAAQLNTLLNKIREVE